MSAWVGSTSAELRGRIAMVSASLTRSLRPRLPALDAVLTGRHAALETWWHEYDDQDRDEARRLLSEAGFGGAGFANDPSASCPKASASRSCWPGP